MLFWESGSLLKINTALVVAGNEVFVQWIRGTTFTSNQIRFFWLLLVLTGNPRREVSLTGAMLFCC